MAVRAPHLHLTLRAFCLGAFVFLGRALEEGDDLPFAFEEHVQRGGPALYEYRPLVRTFVESRASVLASREDARIALDELLREPAAAIFARAHAGSKPSEEQALFRTVLLSLLISTAEGCGGFDWDDVAFERAYAELERSLFGTSRAYAAVAPLVGISVITQVELGGGIRLRAAATGELAHHWPEAQGLLPPGFGREVDRYCVLELERALDPGEEPPDAPCRARRRRLRDPARDGGARGRGTGALRAARLASVRDPPGAARSPRPSRPVRRPGSTRSAPSWPPSC